MPLFIGFQHVSHVSTCFNQGDAGFLTSPPGPDFSKELARMLPYGTFMASTCETAWFEGNNIQKHYKNHRNLRFLMQFRIHHICGHWNF